MIYFDQAATTQPYPEVIEVVGKCLRETWANPSSMHEAGEAAREVLEQSRETIAKSIGAEPEEIYFTSGSTEVINWFCTNMGNFPLYTSKIEHPAVINSLINPKFVKLDKNTVPRSTDIPVFGIALMAYVNNEIGTLLPVKGITDRNAFLLLDATQAYGHIPINVKTENIDMLCCSGQKIHGLPGTGFLYVHKAYKDVISKYPIQYGGGQESGFRAGTQNVVGIAALAKAAEISLENRREKNHKIEKIRNYLYGEITNTIPCAHLNGTANWQKRWCGNLNFRFDGYRGEELQAWFSANGIAVSTGSACSSHDNNPSHVLTEIGLSEAQAGSSIRFTFDETNTMEEAKQVVKVLQEGLKALKK